MNVIEGCITRTPWGSTISILLLTVGEKNSILSYFGPLTACMYFSLFVTRKYHYYSCTIQHSRYDLKIDESKDVFSEPDAEQSDLKGFAIEMMGENKKLKTEEEVENQNYEILLVSEDDEKETPKATRKSSLGKMERMDKMEQMEFNQENENDEK